MSEYEKKIKLFMEDKIKDYKNFNFLEFGVQKGKINKNFS